ncbi:hypothetical protein ScPMuIL_006571 [Solemya velum]
MSDICCVLAELTTADFDSIVDKSNDNDNTPRTIKKNCCEKNRELESKGGLKTLYDYKARVEDELSFKKGDILQLLDKSNDDRWCARHTDSRYGNGPQAEGYVRSNHVALQDIMEAYDWFVGKIDLEEAERRLKIPGNPPGTFLVRKRETCPDAHVLSVLYNDSVKGLGVEHYNILSLDDDGCYIWPERTFQGISDLIDHYKSQADGICVKLSEPCPKPKPVIEDLSRDTKDSFEVPCDSLDLEFEQILGSGTFGEIWQGKWNTNTSVLIRTLTKKTMTVEAFLDVTKIMKECRHDKLVRLYAVCSREESICIVTELMPHGSLLRYLRKGRGRDLPLTPLVDMAAQIASGMSYLESKKFIHRDLAARNILVGENNEVKVADFRLSRALNEDGVYNPPKGERVPVKWTAPEAVLYGKFTTKSDVWSYGILLYELITHGQEPYRDMNNRQAIEMVERGYQMPRPHNCPEPFYEILLKCWKKNPENRPTFEYLCNFLDDYFISIEPIL